MSEEEEGLTVAPAPLPRHERAWRHPSEIGQQRRAAARRPAPPLSPLVTALTGALGLGLVIALVALVVPREAPREVVPKIRNASLTETATQSAAPTIDPGFVTVDGGRFVLAFDGTADSFFVTTGDSGDLAVDIDGRQVGLRRVAFDDRLGITVLRADTNVDSIPDFDRSIDVPEVGTRVVVGGRDHVDAFVGVSATFDTATFVPLAVDVSSLDVPDAALVTSADGRVLGLHARRDGGNGYVPVAAIDDLLSRLG